MIATVRSAKLNGQVAAIPSKSIAHRLLILAGLCDGATKVEGIYPSADVNASIDCLKSLGVTFEKNTVIGGNLNHTAKLKVNESGSTLRFLLPIVAAIGGDFEFICNGRLIDRPNDELYCVLKKNGVMIAHNETIKLSGKLKSGRFEINGNVSSQYISGLLMALPMLDGDSEIVLKSKLSSKNYIDITLSALTKFGIKIEQTESGFKILGNQKYVVDGKVAVEGDWSNSATFLVYSSIKGGVKVSNLDVNSKQGDKNILSIFEKCGVKFKFEEDVLSVKKKNIKPLRIDVDDIIDLAPILAVLLANANGESELYNIKRLRLKESDRVKTTVEMLKNIGILAYEDNDSIHIQGGKIFGGIVNSHNDHRIAMAGAIAGLLSDECVTIEHAEAVNKSYPTFFDDIRALGGIVDVKI